jgi:hypothetical protein
MAKLIGRLSPCSQQSSSTSLDCWILADFSVVIRSRIAGTNLRVIKHSTGALMQQCACWFGLPVDKLSTAWMGGERLGGLKKCNQWYHLGTHEMQLCPLEPASRIGVLLERVF